MDKRIFYWSIMVALAGFLFGFVTVVISGAEKKLQLLWGSSDTFHGVVVIGIALWGTIVGAILGGTVTNNLERKKPPMDWCLLHDFGVGLGSCNRTYPFFIF